MEINFLKKRAEEFLKTSEYHFREGMYELTTFDLEQSLQLFLKYTIYLKNRNYPPTHSLKSLFKILGETYNVEKNLEEITKDKIHLISNLEQAYISSRYLPFYYTKEEVLEMRDFVNKIIKFLEDLWEKI
ncbi:MAG TPA: HEPN domain-containing protein [Caldisericia bacterium]|nr:HEPN domain-containing protein [Caldisericia bacterium]